MFAKSGEESVVPVAMLGLQDQKNLFLGNKGEWKSTCIPAYVRRYPFILAADPSGNNFTVCIDESYSGFNTAKEGERLIDTEGEHGPLLKRSVEFLKEYQAHVQITLAFCKKLQDLDILESAQVNIETGDGQRLSMAGFLCINRQKFKELKAEDYAELVKLDYMDLIYAHFHSLTNLQALVEHLKGGKAKTKDAGGAKPKAKPKPKSH